MPPKFRDVEWPPHSPNLTPPDFFLWGYLKEGKKGKLGAYAIKRVAAGAHLPTPWLFEPAKRPDDTADYCLDCSFLPQWNHRVLVFTLEWSGARPMGEQW